MKLIEYSGIEEVSQVKQLLSYAVGSDAEEELNRILNQVYSKPNRTLYVVTDDTSVTGLVGIKRLGCAAEILHIAVHEQMRRQGIGRRMIDKLRILEKFTELVAETDHDAVEFYRSYGFSIHSLGEKYPGVERFRCTLKFT